MEITASIYFWLIMIISALTTEAMGHNLDSNAKEMFMNNHVYKHVYNGNNISVNDLQKSRSNNELVIENEIGNIWAAIRDKVVNEMITATTLTTTEGSRTFGKIRRLQQALIPIAFKFGVLFSMITFLVMLGVKTLFLLKVLIIVNGLALLSKFFTLKSSQDDHYTHFVGHGGYYGSWVPHHGPEYPHFGKESKWLDA